jgi:hypothetical protein
MRFGVTILCLILLLATGHGCQQEPVISDASVLMAVGSREVRLDEFQRSYRVFRSAYGEEAHDDPAVERASKIRFIRQMADQLVLMAHAHDRGVVVSDETLNKAVQDIRSDYPDDLFDQMLLENAINYEHWKESLRVRLVIDQLVRLELSQNIQITEEDIANYYRDNTIDYLSPESEADDREADHVDQRLVQQLRHQKAEQAYEPWIEGLRAKYPVTIDQEILARIIADSDSPAPEGDRDEKSH